MSRLAIVIGWLLPAIASATPTHLALQQVERVVHHTIGASDSFVHWVRDVSVTLDLLATHELVVTATGASNERTTSLQPTRDEATTWTTHWHGTWQLRGAGLNLELVLTDHACQASVRVADQRSTNHACEAPAEQAQIVCTSEQIAIADLAATARPRIAAVWQCRSSRGSTELGQTPTPWVFGKTACLASEQSAGGERFAACSP